MPHKPASEGMQQHVAWSSTNIIIRRTYLMEATLLVNRRRWRLAIEHKGHGCRSHKLGLSGPSSCRQCRSLDHPHRPPTRVCSSGHSDVHARGSIAADAAVWWRKCAFQKW